VWGGHVGGPGVLMAGLMVLVIVVAAAAVGAVIWFALDLARREVRTHPRIADRAEVILAERYARGEIDANQYWHQLDDIRRHRR
jgi:uncharacterized membrane protein